MIERLTRRLAECPPDFLFEPKEDPASRISVGAVVSDLLRTLGHPGPVHPGAAVFEEKTRTAAVLRHRRLVIIAAWLLHDECFRKDGGLVPATLRFLRDDLPALAALVEPRQFASDQDRREELVRLALRALGLRPAGESEAVAIDRLASLDSVQRKRFVEEASAREKARLAEVERLRRVREEMERKRAAEAASSYGRE
jgi:hypothetical protein